MRSLLIVPADRAAALPEALAARPGAIVFDLGDPGAGDRAAARRAVADLLVAAAETVDRPLLFVRIAALPTGLVDGDLDAILEGRPDAVVAPGIVGARDVGHLGAKLAVREAMLGRGAWVVPRTSASPSCQDEQDGVGEPTPSCLRRRPGETGIVAVAGDSARGILALATLPKAGPRLAALAFDGPALGHAPDSAPVRTARCALVLAAMAAGVPAWDLGEDRSNDLARACALARRDGFSARLARIPREVATIEAGFKD